MMTRAKVVKVAAVLMIWAGAVGTLGGNAARAEDAPAKPAKPEKDAERKPWEDPARVWLAVELPEAAFDGVALSDVVSFLMDLIDVNLVLDRPALLAAGIDPEEVRVTLKATDLSVKEFLEKALDGVGGEKDPAAFDVVGDVIVISTKAGAKDFVTRHRAALDRAGKSDGKALRKILPEVTVEKVELEQVLNFLRDVTNAGIEVNWDELEAAGAERDVPVTVRGRDLTLAQALQLVLDAAWSEKAIGFKVKGKKIVVGRAPDAKDPPPRKGPRPRKDEGL